MRAHVKFLSVSKWYNQVYGSWYNCKADSNEKGKDFKPSSSYYYTSTSTLLNTLKSFRKWWFSMNKISNKFLHKLLLPFRNAFPSTCAIAHEKTVKLGASQQTHSYTVYKSVKIHNIDGTMVVFRFGCCLNHHA